jgi:hypothetical protein
MECVAQRAVLEGRSICSLCGARVSDSAAQCSECGATFEGAFAALSCPFCGAVTPLGPACSICGTQLPSAGPSPLPASWTAGEVEAVPKRKERKKDSRTASPPLDAPKAEAPTPKPAQKPAPAPAPALEHSKKEPERPRPALPSTAAVAPATASPQIPIAARSPLAPRDPTMVDIETSQMEQKLSSLLLRINTAAGKREFLVLRDACVAIAMVLENAGIRPPTDEHEPLVPRKRVEEVARRLRESDARRQEVEEKVKGLEEGLNQLMRQIASEQRSKEAAELLADDSYSEEGLAVVLRRVRANLAALGEALGSSSEAERAKAVKVVEKLAQQIDEVVGKDG